MLNQIMNSVYNQVYGEPHPCQIFLPQPMHSLEGVCESVVDSQIQWSQELGVSWATFATLEAVGISAVLIGLKGKNAFSTAKGHLNWLVGFLAASDNNSLLIWAARHGDIGLVNRLLEFPQVSNNVAAYNNMALRVASRGGHLEVLNRLLEFPQVSNDELACYEALLSAAKASIVEVFYAKGGHLEVLNRLLEFPQVSNNVAADNNLALYYTTGSLGLEVLNRLLEFPQVSNNVAAKNNRALLRAVRRGNLDILNRLLEFPQVRNNVEADNNAALREADRMGYLKVVAVLMNHGAKAVPRRVLPDTMKRVRAIQLEGYLESYGLVKSLFNNQAQELKSEALAQETPLESAQNILLNLVACDQSGGREPVEQILSYLPMMNRATRDSKTTVSGYIDVAVSQKPKEAQAELTKNTKPRLS